MARCKRSLATTILRDIIYNAVECTTNHVDLARWLSSRTRCTYTNVQIDITILYANDILRITRFRKNSQSKRTRK